MIEFLKKCKKIFQIVSSHKQLVLQKKVLGIV